MNGLFPILIEDVDGEMVLFSSFYANTTIYAEDKHNVTITVNESLPITIPCPIASGGYGDLSISFEHLIISRNQHDLQFLLLSNLSTRFRQVHLNVFISVYQLGVGKWYVRNLHCWKQARLPPRALHRSCRSSKIVISFSILSSKSSIMNFDLQ